MNQLKNRFFSNFTNYAGNRLSNTNYNYIASSRSYSYNKNTCIPRQQHNNDIEKNRICTNLIFTRFKHTLKEKEGKLKRNSLGNNHTFNSLKSRSNLRMGKDIQFNYPVGTKLSTEMKRFKPKTHGVRHRVLNSREGLHTGRPLQKLTKGVKGNGGRSIKTGKIVQKGLGGGHKRLQREISFKRRELFGEYEVVRLEYDPNRTTRIALVRATGNLGSVRLNTAQEEEAFSINTDDSFELYDFEEGVPTVAENGTNNNNNNNDLDLNDFEEIIPPTTPTKMIMDSKIDVENVDELMENEIPLTTTTATTTTATTTEDKTTQNAIVNNIVQDNDDDDFSYGGDPQKQKHPLLGLDTSLLSKKDSNSDSRSIAEQIRSRVYDREIENIPAPTPQYTLRYTLLTHGLEVGAKFVSGPHAKIQLGNNLPLKYVPAGQDVFNLDLYPGKGGQVVRSAGSCAQVMDKKTNGKGSTFVLVRLPSLEQRWFHGDCYATIGRASNVNHRLRVLGKAGVSRWLNRRPFSRGVAKNAKDHPHGGKHKGTGGKPLRRPSGIPYGSRLAGVPTRKKFKVNSTVFIESGARYERRKRQGFKG